jgi:hypothetical protein
MADVTRLFVAAAYQGRSRAERLIGKVKEFRRFATRYEQLKAMFLGVVRLALGFIRLRRRANDNTPCGLIRLSGTGARPAYTVGYCADCARGETVERS